MGLTRVFLKQLFPTLDSSLGSFYAPWTKGYLRTAHVELRLDFTLDSPEAEEVEGEQSFALGSHEPLLQAHIGYLVQKDFNLRLVHK